MFMSNATNLQLEIFWKGPYNHKGWEIEGIDIKIKNSACEVYANINRELPLRENQQLSIRLTNKKTSVSSTHSKINIPVALALSMQISVMFPSNKDICVAPGDNIYNKFFSSKHFKHPIKIEETPTLKAGHKYQLIIDIQDENFQAILTQKVEAVVIHALPEFKTDPKPREALEARSHIEYLKASVNQIIHELASNTASQELIDRMERESQKFTRLNQPVESSKLEQSQTARRVQTKSDLVVAEKELARSESSYTDSLSSNDPSKIQEAHINKASAFRRVSRLRDTLKRLESALQT